MPPKSPEKKLLSKPVAAKSATAASAPARSASPTKTPAKPAVAAAVSSPKTAAANGKSSTMPKKATSTAASVKKPTVNVVAKKGTGTPSKAKNADVAPEAAVAAEAAGLQISEEVQAVLKKEALEKAEQEMEELRKKAWQAQVEFGRKEEAKRRLKAEEEAKRRREATALTKAMLEAAFDGEDEELIRLLAKAQGIIKNAVDCCDGHGNTLLSEAAAGGSASTVQLLLERSANPNSQGEFQRTPLWRASFLGKPEVIAPLLQAGADPRLGNEQGELPVHVASQPGIKAMLQEWDVAVTDTLLAKWEARQQENKAAAAAHHAAAVLGAEGQVEAAKESFDQAQKALKHARMELEKRIFEHDTCVEEKKSDELLKVTLEQIHVAETTVEEARKRSAAAAEKLDAARFALRESQAAARDAGEAADNDTPLVGQPVNIKELDDVLIRDVGDKIKASGRWPLVIDPSGQASVFLRYLDTNYVNMLSSQNIEPNRLRRSILGGLRYGKPVVLDLMDIDLWSEMPRVLDAVHPNLLEELLTKSLLNNERYKCLIRQEDGEEYEPNKFQDARVAAFKLVLLTSSMHPNDEMLQRTYPLRVVVNGF